MKSVTEYLDITADTFPNKIAFADERKSVTFSELRLNALVLATYFARKGLFKQPIAVYLDKSVVCISAFMGIAYSGNFYTPLDTRLPPKRISNILHILQPAAILTDHHNFENIHSLTPTTKILIYEDLVMDNHDICDIDSLQNKIIDTDILYVLFTSGSTGVPKGVVISHRAVIDYTEWVAKTFAIDEHNIFGNQAPFYFDNSVLDIYQSIKTGARVEILPEHLFSFPVRLLQYMQDRKINSIFWVPSALCLPANLDSLNKCHVDSLKLILFAGEVMPNKQLNIWRSLYENALFANLYGPTEITDVCSYYVVDREFSDSDVLPIGKACDNTDILLIDAHNNLISVDQTDVVGEIFVRGTCLAYGYYRNPEKTAESFVQNPINTTYNELVYKTGDLAHYNERGELVFDGRKDFQIKHHGYRIELGEIETIVSSLPNVEQVCCIYDNKKSQIIMFYVGNCYTEEIERSIKELLPKYMIPKRIVKLESIPLNANGKYDRLSLEMYDE